MPKEKIKQTNVLRYLLPAIEVWGKVMSSQACIIPSVHEKGGGWLSSMHHRSHDQGSAFRGVGSALEGGGWADTPRDTWDTTGYGQQVGGTHPTRMHFC